MGKKPDKKTLFKKENPFNIKINRQKHLVLGQRVKGTQGLPGFSQAVSHARRKSHWLQRKLKSEKANQFVDKRLMDPSNATEDSAVTRLIKERKRKLRKNIFNLNEEEDLTHKGKPLYGSEFYGGKVSDSEDEEQLPADFVKNVHFGGFSSESKNESIKSHKEVIEDMILESKKRRQEKKIENELNAHLTEKLDKEWKDLLTAIPGVRPTQLKAVPEQIDPFDVVMHELKFEMKAVPANKVKSAEEIAREEEEKVSQLEKERLRRMFDVKGNTDNHISADSIHDNFEDEPMIEGPADITSEAGSDHSENEDSYYSDSDDGEKDLLEKCVLYNTLSGADFDVPLTKQDFNLLVTDNSPDKISTLLENIGKNKSKRNIYKLEAFFVILIEYMLENCSQENKFVLSAFIPHLFTIIQASPLKTAEKFLALLDREYKVFTQGKMKKKNFPRIQALLLLKLSSLFYSISDFYHPVATPAIIFMCDILSSPFSLNFHNVISRLFVCEIILNCTSDSKKLVPECLCFLNKVIQLADSKRVENKRFDLVVRKAVSNENIAELDLLNSNLLQCKDEQKISIISETIEMLCECAVRYACVPSFSGLFSQTLCNISSVSLELYPQTVTDVICELKATLSEGRSVKYLVFPNLKPKPLKLFEPAFDSKFSSVKDSLSKKRKLIKSVSQKIRKEEKGVLREARREAQMIASERLRCQLEADEERRQKVKKLYHDLATQEGEYKKFAKNKH